MLQFHETIVVSDLMTLNECVQFAGAAMVRVELVVMGLEVVTSMGMVGVWGSGDWSELEGRHVSCVPGRGADMYAGMCRTHASKVQWARVWQFWRGMCAQSRGWRGYVSRGW